MYKQIDAIIVIWVINRSGIDYRYYYCFLHVDEVLEKTYSNVPSWGQNGAHQDTTYSQTQIALCYVYKK